MNPVVKISYSVYSDAKRDANKRAYAAYSCVLHPQEGGQYTVSNGAINSPDYNLKILSRLAEFYAMRYAFEGAAQECKLIREKNPKADLEVTVWSATRFASSCMRKLNNQRIRNQPLDFTVLAFAYRDKVMEMVNFADEIIYLGALIKIGPLDPAENEVAKMAVADVMFSLKDRPGPW